MPPPELVKLIVLPTQTALLTAPAVAVGKALTVTDTLAVPEQPPLPVMVTV